MLNSGVLFRAPPTLPQSPVPSTVSIGTAGILEDPTSLLVLKKVGWWKDTCGGEPGLEVKFQDKEKEDNGCY